MKNSKSSIWVGRDDFYWKTDMIGPKANQIKSGYVPRTHGPVNHISISHVRSTFVSKMRTKDGPIIFLNSHPTPLNHPNKILIEFINTSPTRSVYESYPQRQNPTDRPASETANN